MNKVATSTYVRSCLCGSIPVTCFAHVAYVFLSRSFKKSHHWTYCTRSCSCSIYCRSNNTRHKGRKSSVELENSFLTFRSQQTSIVLFLTEKKASDQHKQLVHMCLGSKENPGVFFLILDGKAVSLGECGILKAVDCLFKAHCV